VKSTPTSCQKASNEPREVILAAEYCMHELKLKRKRRGC